MSVNEAIARLRAERDDTSSVYLTRMAIQKWLIFSEVQNIAHFNWPILAILIGLCREAERCLDSRYQCHQIAFDIVGLAFMLIYKYELMAMKRCKC